jgi:hypothetical protein
MASKAWQGGNTRIKGGLVSKINENSENKIIKNQKYNLHPIHE